MCHCVFVRMCVVTWYMRAISVPYTIYLRARAPRIQLESPTIEDMQHSLQIQIKYRMSYADLLQLNISMPSSKHPHFATTCLNAV